MRALIVVLAVFVAGCASTPPEDDPVQIKLTDLDARVARIERVVSNQSLVDLAQHLDDVQSSVRQLRGRIDELENSNEAMRKQQRDLYSDLDKRLGGAPGGSATGGGAQGGSAGSASPPVAAVPPPPAAGSSVEQAVYNQAFDALKASSYSVAITGFRDFLTNYPGSPLAENAQYWLGEAYYVTREYESAMTAFRTVLDKWPNSRKAPDALLKLGYTQYELKRFGDARKTLNDVTQKFPSSDAAKLATSRLAQIPATAR